MSPKSRITEILNYSIYFTTYSLALIINFHTK